MTLTHELPNWFASKPMCINSTDIKSLVRENMTKHGCIIDLKKKTVLHESIGVAF